MGLGHCFISPTPQLRDYDTVILKIAVAANAEVIVTGDLDLLVLTEFNAIPILHRKIFSIGIVFV